MVTSKKLWVTATVLALILAVSAGWKYYKNRESEDVVIGAIFDLTGSLSYMGQWSLEGANLAVEDVNRAGGIRGREMRLVVEDGQTNPQVASTAFRRIITEHHPPVVIGFNGSSEVMAAAPIANESRVLLFSTGGASPRITGAGDYVFRNRLSGAEEASRMADIAFSELGYKHAMILYINTDYGQGYSDAFRERFSALGGAVMSQEAFSQDQTDFRAQLVKVSQQGAAIDFVYLVSHSREAASILKQAKETSMQTKWLASNAVESPDLFAIAGDAADGLAFTVAKYDTSETTAHDFVEAYRRRYGRPPEMFAANAYDGVRMFAYLIRQVGYDVERLKAGLYQLENYAGVSGITSFDPNGDVMKDVALRVAADGQFREISVEELRLLHNKQN